jgi:hypothetical protein
VSTAELNPIKFSNYAKGTYGGTFTLSPAPQRTAGNIQYIHKKSYNFAGSLLSILMNMITLHDVVQIYTAAW